MKFRSKHNNFTIFNSHITKHIKSQLNEGHVHAMLCLMIMLMDEFMRLSACLTPRLLHS